MAKESSIKKLFIITLRSFYPKQGRMAHHMHTLPCLQLASTWTNSDWNQHICSSYEIWYLVIAKNEFRAAIRSIIAQLYSRTEYDLNIHYKNVLNRFIYNLCDEGVLKMMARSNTMFSKMAIKLMTVWMTMETRSFISISPGGRKESFMLETGETEANKSWKQRIEMTRNDYLEKLNSSLLSSRQ